MPLGVVERACNPITVEAETGSLGFSDTPPSLL